MPMLDHTLPCDTIRQIHNIYNPYSQTKLTAVPSGNCQEKEAIKLCVMNIIYGPGCVRTICIYMPIAIRTHQAAVVLLLGSLPRFQASDVELVWRGQLI